MSFLQCKKALAASFVNEYKSLFFNRRRSLCNLHSSSMLQSRKGLLFWLCFEWHSQLNKCFVANENAVRMAFGLNLNAVEDMF